MPERRNGLPAEVVDLTSPGWNSRLGRYFIGQTGELNFGNNSDAWSGIINPYHSGVNVYFDIFTVTNFGNKSFTAELWLNAAPPGGAEGYATITPSNQSVIPPPRPRAYMLQGDYLREELMGGVNIFDRIVTPDSTLVSDSHQGSIIIGPGGTFSILLRSPGDELVKSAIVLTWWEEKTGGR